MECRGVVKKWSSGRGYGFIACDLDGEEVWVHRRAIGDLPDLSVGDKVLFQKVDDGKSRGKFKAEEVRRAGLEPRGRFKDKARAADSTLTAGQQLLQMLKQPQAQEQPQSQQQPPQLLKELLPQPPPPKLPQQPSQLLKELLPQPPPPQVSQEPSHFFEQSPQLGQQSPQLPEQWLQQQPDLQEQQYPLPFNVDWPIKDVASTVAEDRYYECLQKYSTEELARMFVEADIVEHPDLRLGMAINILRHVLREKMGEEQFLWDTRFGSAEGGKIVANVLEEAMATFLWNNGIQFKTETALRLELGSSIRTVDVATPDFLLMEDVRINGQRVCWIDCKCTFGSARILAEGLKSGKSQMSYNLIKQSIRYNQAYGPGAFVYSLGFSEGLADVVASAQRNLVNGGQLSEILQANGRSPGDTSICIVPLFLDATLLDTKKLFDAIAQQSNRKQLEKWHFPQVLARASTNVDLSSIASSAMTLTRSSFDFEPERPR